MVSKGFSDDIPYVDNVLTLSVEWLTYLCCCITGVYAENILSEEKGIQQNMCVSLGTSVCKLHIFLPQDVKKW